MHLRELFVWEIDKANNSIKVVCLSLNFISNTKTSKISRKTHDGAVTFRYDAINVAINYEINWNISFS